MDVTRTSLLRHDVEALDIGSEIVSVFQAEDEPELHDNVACHTCLSRALSEMQQLDMCTFNTSAWPVTIWARTDDGSIIESVRAIRRRWECSQSLRSINSLVVVIQVLLNSQFVPYLNLIKWECATEVLAPDA